MQEAHDANTVAVFERHGEAEAALRELQHGGLNMRRLSIIGREAYTEEQPVGFYNAGERAKFWGKRGAFWGSLVGILFGPAFFWIPGVGFIVTGGLIGSFIMGTLEGAVVGAAVGGGSSALVGALTHMGIPKDSVIRYEQSIQANKFVLIIHGSSAQATRAREILERSSSAEVAMHPVDTGR
jgi:uncharacterized membrane protein